MALYFFILVSVTFIAFFARHFKGRQYLSFRSGVFGLMSKDVYSEAGFWLVFIVLAFFSAVRDGIGIDYRAYEYHISLIQSRVPHYMETGFKTLVLLIARIDNNPRLVIIIAGILTTWFYVRAVWEQSENVCESVFIFISWGYYFLTYNTVRNYFALAFVLYGIRYIRADKIANFVIVVLLAATIHKSALICILLYPAANMKWKNIYYAGIPLLTVLLLLFKRYIRSFVFLVYSGYEGSAYDTGRVSYLNIVKALVVIVLCLISRTNIINEKMMRFYFHLNLISLVLYVGLYWLPEISRIGFYLNATSIFLVPGAIKYIKSPENRRLIRVGLLVFSLLLFFLLCRGFYSETTLLLPYKTWLTKGNY